jgi:hypothetical protein
MKSVYFLLGNSLASEFYVPTLRNTLSVSSSQAGRYGISSYLHAYEGTAVAQWLRYCATNQKVTGSIPDVAMEFFIDIYPSDRMALGLTQSLTEMSTGSISWG